MLGGNYKYERYIGQEGCFIGRRLDSNRNVANERYAILDADGLGPRVAKATLSLAPNGKRLGISKTVVEADGSRWTSNSAAERVPAKKMRKKLRNKWTPATGTRSPAHCLRGVPL